MMTEIPSDKKGGRKTPAAAGIMLMHRNDIWAELEKLPEGQLFKAEDINSKNPQWGEDFGQMRNYDYVHVNDGYLVATKEGRTVRGLPNPTKVAHSWLARFNHHDTLVEFGDWTAHRMGLYPWEPIAGYRWRCDTPKASAVLSLGHMKLRIEYGPEWLRDNTKEGKLFRALHDMPTKTLGYDIYSWVNTGNENRKQQIEDLRAFTSQHDDAWEAWEDLDTKGNRPSSVIDTVLTALRTEKERREK